MTLARRKRIGVLVGGDPPEREISLAGGEAVRCVLRDAGYDAFLVHVDRHVDVALRQERVEIAFVLLRGRLAAGPIQGLCESLGIPYTGPSLAAAALAADKLKTKELLRLHGVPTPAHYCYSTVGDTVEQHHGLGWPCVVKPRRGATGIGLSLARDPDELEAAVEAALRFDHDALVERYVPGCEVQVAILDGAVLAIAELAEGGLLDFTARQAGRARVHIPPRLSRERLRGAETLALRAHHLVGAEGLTRVDLMISEETNEHVLEVEALPELQPGAVLPKLAHAAGLGFEELVLRVLDGAKLQVGWRAPERRTGDRPFAPPDRRAIRAAEPH